MINIRIYHVDSSMSEWEEDEAIIDTLNELMALGYEGKELVNQLLTDDWGAPPRSVILTGTRENGEEINIALKYQK